MTSDPLSAMQGKIASELSRRPECFITHPTEVRILQRFDAGQLTDFANQNGWRVVRRLGGRQWQFYNDTTERLLNETGTTPAAGM